MRPSSYPAMPALLPLGELVAPFNSASRSAIRPSVSDADGDAGSGSETAMIMRGALIFVSILQLSGVSHGCEIKKRCRSPQQALLTIRDHLEIADREMQISSTTSRRAECGCTSFHSRRLDCGWCCDGAGLQSACNHFRKLLGVT